MRWQILLCQRMVSNFGNTVPTICLFTFIALAEQCFLVVPNDIIRPICHAPQTEGMMQVAFGKAVITPQYRCL